MGRKIDKDKYERILKRINDGETQSQVVLSEKCSYGTISAAKEWEKEGKPTTLTTKIRKTDNSSKIIFTIPNFWLELLNDNIEEGVWMDYSDAIVDIIRTYFRTRMDETKSPSGGIPTFADKGINFFKIRKDVLQEYKTSFIKEEIAKEVAEVIPLKKPNDIDLAINEAKEKRKEELEAELKRINEALQKRELKEN